MEATGKYGIKLATFFYEAGHRISVVNPAQVKGFAQSQLARIKTDKADAILIAQFCKAIGPGLWKPTGPWWQFAQNHDFGSLCALKRLGF